MNRFSKYAFALITVMTMTFVAPVLAADTATVTATVTAQNISVSVSDGTITYGIMAVNTSKDTTAGSLNDAQTATNNGNVAEDFNIRGQDSAAWVLGASAGSEQYTQKFCLTSCTSYPTSYTSLTTSYQTLANSVATSGNQLFHIGLTTPTATATYTSQSVDVIVQAVAD
jgi:hypothetical protein